MEIRFARKDGRFRYLSDETLYSEPNCEISVLRTTTLGTWTSRGGTILTLKPASVKLTPLDPRIADAWDGRRACGKRWLNGEANELIGTACGREKIAQYFIGRGPKRALALYECEGKSRVDASCTRYRMNASSVYDRTRGVHRP